MKSKTTKGMICLDGPYGLVYQIGIIAYTVFEDESFRYEFIPKWEVIDLLELPDFQGVPGFDLDVRKDVYVRENITPTFISERAPAENREGLWQLLDDVGMDYLDKVEWLIRTDTRYIGDSLYVRSLESLDDLGDVSAEIGVIVTSAQNSMHALQAILRRLCAGAPIEFEGDIVGSEARKVLHGTLLALLVKSYAYRESKRKDAACASDQGGVHAGRKRKALDKILLAETLDMYSRGVLDAEQAACRLDISMATFYRRLKEYREA